MKKLLKQMMVIGAALALLLTFNLTTIFGYTDYTTDKFDVDVKVQEDNSYLVSESITVDFQAPHHGIYRYIPTKGIEVEDVDVDDYEYTDYEEDGNEVIQIGSADSTVTGKHTYKLTYKIRVYDDKDTLKDIMSLDLIPTNWDTPIKAASINVEMPKKTDFSSLNVYYGSYGSASSSAKVPHKVNENENSFSVVGKEMAKGEGITAEMTFKEGYWQDQMNNDGMLPVMGISMILIPALLLLLWFTCGRDPKVVKTVEFYAPEKITPAEVGYIIDGTVDQQDIVSMIMYYADKGYLEIEEYKKNKFLLKKKCDIPTEEKAFARTIFDGLFMKSNQVAINELDEDFGDSYIVAVDQLENNYNKKNNVYTLKSILARFVSLVLMGLPAVVTAICSLTYGNAGDISILAAILLIPIFLGGFIIVKAFDKKFARKKGSTIVRMVIGAVIMFIGIVASAFIAYSYTGSLIWGLGVIVSTIVCLFITCFMKARTKKSAELLGKILGFKEFIRQAEVPKLKKLVEENPSYFYNVLPYAYVLGLSNKWAKNFEGIPTSAPTWYYGYDNSMFNTFMFMSVMNHCNTSFGNNIKINIPDKGDSGFGSFGGGGGFSGGGFGGGGGGAW